MKKMKRNGRRLTPLKNSEFITIKQPRHNLTLVCYASRLLFYFAENVIYVNSLFGLNVGSYS